MSVAVLAEVKAAKAFLKYLKADYHNKDLIYAVIAWMRQESGAFKNIIGNNPFNLRPGKDIDPDLIAGVRKGKVGYFLVFKSLEAGLIATAQRLLRAGDDWRDYGLIVRAFRSGRVFDAIAAISLSAWNPAHYGYDGKDIRTSHIYQRYAEFTGMQVPGPAKPKQPKKHKRRLMSTHPADFHTNPIVRNYIDGWAAGTFYRSRHEKRPTLTGLDRPPV